MKKDLVMRVTGWFVANWRWLLVLSVLPLFTSNALYNIPLIIMALLGVKILIRERASLRQRPEIKWLLLGFAALWLPQMIALVDAVEIERSLKTALSYPAYLLAALFVSLSLGARDLQKLAGGILLVVAIWIIDTLLAWSGLESWLGYKSSGIQITGVLFDKLTLGHIVAVLSPLIFDYLRRHVRSPLAWLLLIGAVLVVMLTGRRVAWMMLTVAGAGYLIYMVCVLRSIRPASVGFAALIFMLVPAALYVQYKPFQSRVDITLGVFSSNTGVIDKATAHRLDIWDNAASMAAANWINGVGPRGFRYVYKDYAETDDYWVRRGGNPTHPHQFMLEIAAETGIIGIIGYLVFWLSVFLVLRNSAAVFVWPFALALCIALFPLNSHVAFYASYWSAFTWWLIGLFYAAAGTAARDHAPAATAVR